MSEQAPAGWYPLKDGTQRYWDGQQWTEHIAPLHSPASEVATAEPIAANAVAPAPAADDAVETLPLGTVPAMAAQPTPTGAPVADARPWWKKKRFVVPGAALIVVFGFSAIASGSSDGAKHGAADPKPSATTTSSTFAMPELVGMGLQDAQNALQALGSRNLTQTDASGQSRTQIIDSNWIVCTQTPAAGSVAAIGGEVVLASVKLDETCPGDEPAASAQPIQTPQPSATAQASETPEPSPTPTATEPEEPTLTATQEQAVGTASDYLEYSSFSRSGLIHQLKFEGFSTKAATFGVDYLHVNWSKQALATAKNYLESQSFSKSGLIHQLKFEGFSTKQANYALAHMKVNWNNQAAATAKSYLESQHFSHSGLVHQLMFEGFTKSQAEYGVKKAGL